MRIERIISEIDNLELELAIIEPKIAPKEIIQLTHGMAEHKGRYYDFMEYLAEQGYICVIHDHRGHGASVRKKEDLGYFYSEDINCIIDDLHQVTKFIKKRYEGLEVILFGHSMGTLVASNYLKKYDSQIKKLVLCGPPTANPLTPLAIFMAKGLKLAKGDRHINKFLNKLSFGNYNKGNELEFQWLSTNTEIVNKYNEDSLCGYIFTTNGFINLYKLLKEAFNKKNWDIGNEELDIFVIAGKDDPVIQNEDKFNSLISFLKDVGYSNVDSKLYQGKRHELLNEIGKEEIYQDVLEFIEK
ncbi:alpha/beta fold hydrolase [Alloiococcus sp. CFN-8]|uniref:alpha/beta fold hydrolase n=1 Tax=Alloiococcus sp. CFN-8 TaxID=3416081 RepID=UPI003CF46B8A